MIASTHWLGESSGPVVPKAGDPRDQDAQQPVGLVLVLCGAGAWVLVAGVWAVQLLYRLPAERAVTASAIVLGGVWIAAPVFWLTTLWLSGRRGSAGVRTANRGALGMLAAAFVLGPVALVGPGWGTAFGFAALAGAAATALLVRASARMAPLVPAEDAASRPHHDRARGIARAR